MSFRNTAYILSMVMSCTAFSTGFCQMENQPLTQLEEVSLDVSTYSADQIEPLLPLLEEWVQREFLQYPYLWAPPKGENCLGNTKLLGEKTALVTLVRKGEEVIGVAAGVALDSESYQEYLGKDLIDSVKEKGFSPSALFYMSYFLTAEKYRNDESVVELIYNQYSEYARSIGYTQLCFFIDPGKPDHPLKPEVPVAIEPWGYVISGYRSMDVIGELSWPTLQPDGSIKEEAHVAEFFVKDL